MADTAYSTKIIGISIIRTNFQKMLFLLNIFFPSFYFFLFQPDLIWLEFNPASGLFVILFHLQSILVDCVKPPIILFIFVVCKFHATKLFLITASKTELLRIFLIFSRYLIIITTKILTASDLKPVTLDAYRFVCCEH